MPAAQENASRTRFARAVLKRPDLLILNEATAALDGASQSRVTGALIKEFNGRGLVWALHRPSLAENFDHVLVMQGGKVAEQGTFEQLGASNGALKELIEAE